MTAVAQPSLYERLGGEEGIARVVDTFYDMVLADPRVAHFFANTDMAKQRRHQTLFLTFATGGPNKYTGRSMREAHRGWAFATNTSTRSWSCSAAPFVNMAWEKPTFRRLRRALRRCGRRSSNNKRNGASPTTTGARRRPPFLTAQAEGSVNPSPSRPQAAFPSPRRTGSARPSEKARFPLSRNDRTGSAPLPTPHAPSAVRYRL